MRKWSLSFCWMLLSLCISGVALGDIINFDNVPEAQGLDQLYFLEGDIDGVHFSSPDPYDPAHPELGGWLGLNRDNLLTMGVSSLHYSIFSGMNSRGRIEAEFPNLVNYVQITGGDMGNLSDSFRMEAYDSSGNLLTSADTGLFSGGGLGGPYYVDQGTLSLSAPNIKYIYFYATTPFSPNEGGISLDDLVFQYQSVPIPAAIWLFGPGLAFILGNRKRFMREV
jgi:hypothetical protein